MRQNRVGENALGELIVNCHQQVVDLKGNLQPFVYFFSHCYCSTEIGKGQCILEGCGKGELKRWSLPYQLVLQTRVWRCQARADCDLAKDEV